MSNFTPQQIEEFLQEFFDVVGARQYVGARYVPIFGRAGEDTIEWDDLAPYEPLTVVMHEGVSYVSRRYVPTGIQISDTAYWAQTYRFDAQVEQYRQEVLGFQGQIDALRDDLETDYVPFPDSVHYPKYGTAGQVLATLADGGTRWDDPVTVTEEIAGPLIDAWLDDHPEATTTVQDNSLTTAKMTSQIVSAMTGTKTGNDYADANDFPLNRIVRVDGSTYPIAHLAAQNGLVVTLTNTATNAILQLQCSTTGGIYTRYKHFENWTAWKQIDDIPDGSVTNAKLADETVQTAKVSNQIVSAITGTKTGATYANADNFPLNRIVRVDGSVTPIANLAEQNGLVVTLTNTATNAIMQLQASTGGAIYYRYCNYGNWRVWRQVGFGGVASPRSLTYMGNAVNFDGLKIALVGDSITAGVNSTGYIRYNVTEDNVTIQVDGNGPDYPDAGPGYQTGTLLRSTATRRWYTPLDGNGWGQRLKAYLEGKFDCTVDNYGLASCSISTINSVIIPQIQSGGYDLVIVGMGANDRVSEAPVSQFYTNYLAFVRVMTNSGINCIVWSENPGTVDNEELASRLFHMEDACNVSLNVAASMGVPFVNVYDEMLAYAKTSGVGIDSLLSGIHPNDNGYEVIYEILMRAFGLGIKRPNASW